MSNKESKLKPKEEIMKKIIFLLTLPIVIVGCKSEEEKIHDKQVEVCKENIKSGQEPSAFCLSLLPEYRTVAPQVAQQSVQANPQAEPAVYQDQQYQQPVSQQPQVVYQQAPQPQVIQQAPAQSSGMTDMLVGGLIGHAIGSSGNNGGGGSSNNHYYSSPSTPRVTNNVTRNVTVIQRASAPAPTPAAQKKNYMDMSKLSAPIPKASAPRPSAMNMSKLSSYGKRK